MRTREEHLQWAKDNAMWYWRKGDLQSACASMVKDMSENEETKSTNEYLLALGIIYATNQDHDGMRRWIEGFR